MSAAVTVANPAAAAAAPAAAAAAPAAQDVKNGASVAAAAAANPHVVPDAVSKFKAADVKATATEGLVTIDGKELVPYYAIGSMMNIVSMNLRELFPYRSTAGELKGFELVFKGMNGMASVDAKEGASLHGVLHYITPKEMEALDKIEASYNRLLVDIHLYDADKSVVKGYVYQMDLKRFPAMTSGVQNPPSERYIDIITRGAKYHGVSPAFIEWLNRLQVVPRRKPSEFKTIPDPDGLFAKVKVTCAQLKAMDGCEGRDLGVCINRKVMRFAGDLKTPGGQSSYNWAKGRFSGKDNTVGLSHTLYEPMYPIAKRFCDMSAEQRAWCEDFYSHNWTGMWQPVGLLCDMPADA